MSSSGAGGGDGQQRGAGGGDGQQRGAGDGDGQQRRAGPTGPVVVLRAGPPAWCAAAMVPLGALWLVVPRLSSGATRATGEPIGPWGVAAFTLALAAVVAWRTATGRAELDADGLRCRNALTTFEVGWAQVERLEVVRRAGVVVVEVRVLGLRRRLRLGAATRFSGAEADAVGELLRAHPGAGPRVVDPGMH